MVPPHLLESYPCPVCDGIQHHSLYKIKEFNIARCNDCRMVFVNPRLKNEHIFNLYKIDYFNNPEHGYSNYNLTQHLRIKTYERWYNEVLPYLKLNPGKLALDIGCASGDFLHLLEKKNWKVKGIELDRNMLEKLREQKINVVNSTLEEFSADEKYDLISLLDVIEHLPNLHDNIRKLAGLLAEDGSILLVTPDFGSFQRKLFGKRWFQFKPKEHISYFSGETLKQAIKRHGLKIVYISSSGQYADASFLHDRLLRYGFTFFARIFVGMLKLINLKNKSWYADTGSMLVVIQKVKDQDT